MSQEIILKSGWVKIDKSELDRLRQKIREEYEKAGGNKKFNAHLPNYEELRELIYDKFYELKNSYDIIVKIQDLPGYDIVPGNTFFRNLLYTNKNLSNIQFQEYNIDICYLFAFGKRRSDWKKSEKKSFELIPQIQHEYEKFKVIISSTINNMTEAEKIKKHLLEKFDVDVEYETRNIQAYSKGSIYDLYTNLDNHTYIFILISRDYLQNETCVRDLIDFTKNNIDLYLSHTFHLFLKDVSEGDFNIFDSLGRSELLKYWKLRISKLEENHKLIIKGKKDKDIYQKLHNEFDEIKIIIEELYRLLDLLKDTHSKVLFDYFLNKVNTYDDLLSLLPEEKKIDKFNIKYETIYKRIKIPSNNNPEQPEFPPEPFYHPKFPASETYKIKIPGFSNIWLKDESTNPTGTHKDRLAWEVVIKYKSLIESLKYKSQASLPQMSIISSGSAAIAIQHLFNLFKIPTKLKVLVDNNLKKEIKNSVRNIGCELYECNLSEKLLSSEEIKEKTENENGIDITYREILDPTHDNYYDWMSYEILREKPDYTFVPFGTGDLFINILNIVKIEYFNSFVSKHDPRFLSNLEIISKCQFMGASTRLPSSKLDKLFSYYLPSIASFKKYIQELKDDYGCIGELSDIYYVEEKFVDEAIEIASQQKIKFEPSGMAGLALLLQIRDTIPKNSKILIVSTGKTKDIKDLLKS